MNRKTLPIFLLSALALSACGSSGGNSEPPPPPAPVAPPPPPPEPTFEERLADLAAFDPNPCRAETPGFEALGGWLANDGRELGTSRVWIRDQGSRTAPLSSSHGARVWAAFTACAVRSDTSRYFSDGAAHIEAIENDGADAIDSRSASPPWQDIAFPEPSILPPLFDGEREEQRILSIQALGNTNGRRTSHLQTPSFQASLLEADRALWIVVGGYTGSGDDRQPAKDVSSDIGIVGSSLCSDAAPLCLFAPWQARVGENQTTVIGTSIATPQVAAALDTVWTVWPDMDILDLRNLAFDCAENMAAREGDTSTERSYSYSNGRSFTSTTNSTWGHGILSLTCLFTPNGGLQNPVTGNPISGGISGPLAGPITGALITGLDYTGRDFGYGFAQPVARENYALLATTAVQPSARFSRKNALGHGSGAILSVLAKTSRFSLDLTASGNAIGVVSGWRIGGLTLRGGFAAQPEGVGSLTGSRAFRAPSAVSAAIAAAYAAALPNGFSAHVQADHWRTLATMGRSLWESAQLSESRISAALVKRLGQHEFILQGVWRSGLSGSLEVSGRPWAVAPQRETGVWLTWKR